MNMNAQKMQRLGQLALSISFLVTGLVFLILGVTVLPVIGVFIGLTLLALALYPWLGYPYHRNIQILIGRKLSRYVSDKTIVPVAILSAPQQEGSGGPGFDASNVDVSSLRFGPNRVEPIRKLTIPVTGADQLRDVKGEGKADLVLYFPIEGSGVTPESTQACITGRTKDGEAIEGCSPIHFSSE